MKPLFLFLALTLSLSKLSAQTFDDDLRTFFKVNGSEKTFKNVISLMLNNFKDAPNFSEIPIEYWDELEKEMSTGYLSLENALFTLYKKHFTQNDIKELIKFYQSPVGMKMVATQTAIQTEAFQIGSEWGKKIGQEVAEKLLQKIKK